MSEAEQQPQEHELQKEGVLPREWLPTVTRGHGFLEISTSRVAWAHAQSDEERRAAEEEPDREHTGVWQAVEAALRRRPDAPFLGAKHTDASGEWGPYEWLTFGEALGTVEVLATRFAQWGIRKGENAAIVASNSPEWVCSHRTKQ